MKEINIYNEHDFIHKCSRVYNELQTIVSNKNIKLGNFIFAEYEQLGHNFELRFEEQDANDNPISLIEFYGNLKEKKDNWVFEHIIY